jgi:hypothetical protein
VDKFSLSFTVSEILLTGRDQKIPISEDNGCQVAAIPHMTVTTFVRVVFLICIAQLNDSFQGVGEPQKKKKNKIINKKKISFTLRIFFF